MIILLQRLDVSRTKKITKKNCELELGILGNPEGYQMLIHKEVCTL